ncbi:hypothetical protein [Microbacterium aerolatum]|uniref:hypothetical protein n=1 Tax=Microbacterium aerolatum TaxID=153731 RepID=UPI00384BA919
MHDQQQYISYEQCTAEQLEIERTRIKGNLTHMRRRRYTKFGVFGTVGAGLGFLGLWLLNNVDPAFVGIIGVVIAGLTLWFSHAAWATPKNQEISFARGLEQIHQIQQYRADSRKKKKSTRR